MMQEIWQCRKLNIGDHTSIEYVVVWDLLEKTDYSIKANIYIICAGAVLTPQILYNSDIRPRALGH